MLFYNCLSPRFPSIFLWLDVDIYSFFSHLCRSSWRYSCVISFLYSLCSAYARKLNDFFKSRKFKQTMWLWCKLLWYLLHHTTQIQFYQNKYVKTINLFYLKLNFKHKTTAMRCFIARQCSHEASIRLPWRQKAWKKKEDRWNS